MLNVENKNISIINCVGTQLTVKTTDQSISNSLNINLEYMHDWSDDSIVDIEKEKYSKKLVNFCCQ